MKNLIFVVLSATLIFSCSTRPCKIEDRTTAQTQEQAKASVDQMKNEIAKGSVMNRIKIYKPDGTLQCNQGQKISLDDMSKELKNIKIYSKENLHDGLMRIQMCGKPTGYNNVFEIDQENLAAAEKLGFKKWVR